jgi:hypothetical protein
MNTMRKMCVVVAACCLAVAACNNSVTISTTSLPTGTAGQAYRYQLQGQNVASWSVTAGALPPGLTLSAAGVVSGTPTTAGTYPFTVTAAQDTTTTSPTVTQMLTLTIS